MSDPIEKPKDSVKILLGVSSDKDAVWRLGWMTVFSGVWVLLTVLAVGLLMIFHSKLPESMMIFFAAGKVTLISAHSVTYMGLLIGCWIGVGVLVAALVVQAIFARLGNWAVSGTIGLFLVVTIGLLLGGMGTSVIWQFGKAGPIVSMPSDVRNLAFTVSMIGMMLGLVSTLTLPRFFANYFRPEGKNE